MLEKQENLLPPSIQLCASISTVPVLLAHMWKQISIVMSLSMFLQLLIRTDLRTVPHVTHNGTWTNDHFSEVPEPCFCLQRPFVLKDVVTRYVPVERAAKVCKQPFITRHEDEDGATQK